MGREKDEVLGCLDWLVFNGISIFEVYLMPNLFYKYKEKKE